MRSTKYASGVGIRKFEATPVQTNKFNGIWGTERQILLRQLLSCTALTGVAFALAVALQVGPAHAQEVVADGTDVELDASAPIEGVKATNEGTVTGEGAEIVPYAGNRPAVEALSGGVITLSGGSVGGEGSQAKGLSARDEGSTILGEDLDISFSGNNTVAASVSSGGQIELTGGRIEIGVPDTTARQEVDGLWAGEGGGKITANDVEIVVTGTEFNPLDLPPGENTLSWAIRADGNNAAGEVELNGGSVTATGLTIGLGALTDGALITSSADVSVNGDGIAGAYALSGGTINLTGGAITSTGSGSPALQASVGGSITSAADVLAAGAESPAVYASSGGEVNLTGGVVRASGTDAMAVRIRTGGMVTATDTTIASDDGAGVQIENDGSFQITDGELTSAGPSFAASFTQEATSTIRIGDGATVVQNNGNLLEVTRADDGDAGVVALTVGAGAVAAGDIRDEGAGPEGGTDVLIEEGAEWTGETYGVRNFTSLQQGGIDFADGSNIGGDLNGNGSNFTFGEGGGTVGGNVTLTQNSRTSGGSMDSPVQTGGNVYVDNTSTLGGNWGIGGDLDVDGTLSPGNSIGLVMVAGNHTFGPASVYEVEINADGQADRLDVTGTATLDGTVQVTPLDGPGDFLLGQPYTIVTAGGGFAGSTFDEATWGHHSDFLMPSLSYDASNAYVTIDRNGVAFASAAATPNQAAAAAGLDSLSFGNAAYDAVALSTADGARQAFDALSGEIHASTRSALLDESRHLRAAVTERTRQAFMPSGEAQTVDARPIPGTSASMWMRGFGSWGHLDGDGNAAKVDRDTGGFVLGADGAISETWRLGFAAGYSHTSLDANDRRSSAAVDSYHSSVYGGARFGALGLRLGAAHSWHGIDSDRSISFPGFSDSASADYDARTAQVFGEVGYAVRVGGVGLEPFGGLSYVRLDSDDFTEEGGDAALTGDDDSADIGFSTLGLRAAKSLDVGAETRLTVRGMVGWRHAYGDVSPAAALAFEGGAPFSVEGAPVARDAAVVEAGLDLRVGPGISVGAAYAGQLGDDAADHGVTANLTVKF